MAAQKALEAEVLEAGETGRAKPHARIANLRDHILSQSAKLPHQMVHVLDWDEGDTECWVEVWALTGKQRAVFQQQILAQTPGAQPGQQVRINWDRFWADIVILATHDPEDGALVFAPTDRDRLLEVAAKPLEVVASVARKLSGLDETAMNESKSPDEADGMGLLPSPRA